jgi:hypothetical protein
MFVCASKDNDTANIIIDNIKHKKPLFFTLHDLNNPKAEPRLSSKMEGYFERPTETGSLLPNSLVGFIEQELTS